jgi:NAD-dependent deacetylase
MPLEEKLLEAAAALKAAKRVAVLTGAGVSAESGVPTFRASDGLWEGHHIEDVATPEGFRRDPKLVWSFYNARRANVTTVKPNAGHYALAAMESHFDLTLATQNVDGLHAEAGSRNVIELHGSLRRTRCLGCGIIEDRGLEPLGEEPLCPQCSGRLRPDIVWFHEMLPVAAINGAMKAARSCDVLLVIGTSAVVYPAAGMIPEARNATIIEINLQPTEASNLAHIGLYGPSGQVLPKLCEQLGIVLP